MEYKVKSGDGWYRIAKNLGVDVNVLLKANNATLNTPVYTGQVLKTGKSVGVGKYAIGLTPKEEKPKTMPTPYRAGYTEQQFIKDNARSIQDQLTKAGYSVGKVDGIWGKNSQAALDKALSEGYKLERGKLVSPKKATPQTTPTSNPFIPAGYQAGAVRHLQGQVTKSEPKAEPKKDKEPAKEEPKKQSAFWQSMGSVALGSYGAYSGLKSEEKPQISEAESIKQNARNIQAQLKSAGYNLGKVDGVWGPKSQAALDQAKKDGFTLQNGKLVSGRPATTARAFVPVGSQAMVQRGQAQTQDVPTTTGSAFYISYPEHKISTTGTGFEFLGSHLPEPISGHAASIIIDANGNATYHTYGRYGDMGSYKTNALPARRKGESEQDYLKRIRPHLEYAAAGEPVRATYITDVDAEKARAYYKEQPQKGNYGFFTGSTCVGEACNGINAGRSGSIGDLAQFIMPNFPGSPHKLNYGSYETYDF